MGLLTFLLLVKGGRKNFFCVAFRKKFFGRRSGPLTVWPNVAGSFQPVACPKTFVLGAPSGGRPRLGVQRDWSLCAGVWG